LRPKQKLKTKLRGATSWEASGGCGHSQTAWLFIHLARSFESIKLLRRPLSTLSRARTSSAAAVEIVFNHWNDRATLASIAIGDGKDAAEWQAAAMLCAAMCSNIHALPGIEKRLPCPPARG
jgi:hypothetical protein